MTKPNYEVVLQPIGRRIEVPAGTNLLDAARLAGVELVAICGGEGTCGTCRVRPVSGQLSPRTLTEQAELSDGDLVAGDRLACQAEVLSDVRVDIPPESLTTPQRLQLEGQEIPTALDPVVVPLEVEVPPPSLSDLRSDLTRLRDVLTGFGHADLRFSLPVSADLPEKLRANNWRIRLALRGDEVVAVLPPISLTTDDCSLITDHCSLYGLAVDVGTTKLAAYLVNLETGETAAKAGAMNPQIAYGEDVISRIAYVNDHPDEAQTLQAKLVERLDHLVDELCAEAKVSRAQVVEAVIVGNTAMHHLFAGLPVKQLGEAPYVAAVGEAMEFPASQVGLELAVGAYVYLPPNIAGYIGADHVSMLLGAGVAEVIEPRSSEDREERLTFAKEDNTSRSSSLRGKTILALDIGTNTEISLFHAGTHYSCSCASGPAFEGAHITDGMRAAPGAIERVRIDGEAVQVHTIGGGAPVGICGSGILDAVAELLKSGLLDARGVLKGLHPLLRVDNNKPKFILTPAEKSGAGRDVAVSRQDVNEIQLAKGAIRAGIEILLKEAGIEDKDIHSFIVAGAFGTYLDLESAIRIGMFPDLPRPRFKQVGNAAGGGARRLLVSKKQRKLADEIACEANYIELAVHPDFMQAYVKALAFG